jgi:hypothetical protein
MCIVYDENVFPFSLVALCFPIVGYPMVALRTCVVALNVDESPPTSFVGQRRNGSKFSSTNCLKKFECFPFRNSFPDVESEWKLPEAIVLHVCRVCVKQQ